MIRGIRSQLLSLVLLGATVCGQALLPRTATAADDKPSASAELTPMWFMFFVQGENRTPLAKEDAPRLQAEHIGNLTRLWNEKKALAAGPFGERGPLRGIVVLTVKERTDVEAEFRNDPFVKAGYLKPEIHRWFAPRSAFGTPDEPPSMAKFQFVILKKGPSWSATAAAPKSPEQLAHVGYVRSLQEQGLVAAGPLQDAGDLQGLLIFAGEDAEKVNGLVAKDPHVAAGRLVAERRLLFVGKGVLRPAASKSAP